MLAAGIATGTEKKECMKKPDASSRCEALDALRGLCACTVAFNHFRFAFADGWDPPYVRGVTWRWDNCALIAVYVFFIISGHVIAYRYLQTGTLESLLGAAFRRVPRLVVPVLAANLILWLLAVLGANRFEEGWRSIQKQMTGVDTTWCNDCFPTDLGVVIQTSLSVMWTFHVEHFLWIWTIPIEIFGSAMVFLLAPLLRSFINFGFPLWRSSPLQPHGSDNFIRLGGLLWPERLVRCLAVHGMLLTVVFVVGGMYEHCHDITGRMAPDSWCAGPQPPWFVMRVVVLWRIIFLFELGLASAQIRVLLSVPAKWTQAVKSKWSAQWQTKWLPAAGCALFGLGACTAEPNGSMQLGDWLSIEKTLSDMIMLGSAAIFLGVLLSPVEIRERLSKLSFLGDMAFSIYLLHMGVIWSIGLPLYVWLHGHLKVPPGVMLPLIFAACAGPLLFIARGFWLYIEEPLGVRLPQQTFNALKQTFVGTREHWERMKIMKASLSV